MSTKSDKAVAFDVECYTNYFYVLFKTQEGTLCEARLFNDKLTGSIESVKAVFKNNPLISFNGENYDIPLVSAFIKGWTNAQLKELSDKIILENVPSWQLRDHYPRFKTEKIGKTHIDLVGVTPLQASLKAYGCRIHSRKLQDLPIAPDTLIQESDTQLLEAYCSNDVDVTWDIYNKMLPELKLRKSMSEQYKVDLRSKSDPQIAESVIRHYLEEEDVKVEKRTGKIEPFAYTFPEFIAFNDSAFWPIVSAIRLAKFKVKSTGNVELPDEVSRVIEYAGAQYKMGIGGLHSQEKKQVIEPRADQMLGEYDVASMYPSIILGQSLYPEHIGEKFIDVYRDIYTRRLEAKRTGDKTTADTLKIVLNASYGKFGSKYSFLYSPELLIQTTITGQLALLMLIERITETGAKVVSANTDGVVVLMDRAQKCAIDKVCALWSDATTYQLEWTEYKALYSESVNSYVALKPGGGSKTKGLYESGSIRKGYSAQVCNDAIVDYLDYGIPLEETIESETDIRQFLIMRGVRGGGVWRGEALGKVVRWYIGTNGEEIRYKTNGNKVAGSDFAVPMMDLVDGIPADLDKQRYVEMAEKKLKRLGV